MRENNRIPCYKKTGSGDVKSDRSTTYSSSVSINDILSNQSQDSCPRQHDSMRNMRQVSVNTIEFMDPPTPRRAGTFPTPVPVSSTPGSADFFGAKPSNLEGRLSPTTNNSVAIASSNIAAASKGDSYAKIKFPDQPFSPLQRPKLHNKLISLDDKQGFFPPEPTKVIRVPVYGKLTRSSLPKVSDPEMQRIFDTLPGTKKVPSMNVTGVGKQPVRKPHLAKPDQQNGMSQKPVYDVNGDPQKIRSVTFSELIKVMEPHSFGNHSMRNDNVKGTKTETPLSLNDRIKILQAKEKGKNDNTIETKTATPLSLNDRIKILQAKEKGKNDNTKETKTEIPLGLNDRIRSLETKEKGKKVKQFKDSRFDSHNAAPIVNKAVVCNDKESDIKKPLSLNERIKILEAQAKEQEKKTDRKLLNDVFFSPEDISPIGVASPTHLEPLCSLSDPSLVERALTPTDLLATLDSKTRLDEAKNTELELTDIQQADDQKAEKSRIMAEKSHVMAEKSHIIAEKSHIMAEKSTDDRKTAPACTQKDEVTEFLDKFAPKKYDADIEKLRLEAKDSNKLMLKIQEGMRLRLLKVEDCQMQLDKVKKYYQDLTARKDLQVERITSMEQAARNAGCLDQVETVIQKDVHLYQRLVEQEAIICHQINMLEVDFGAMKAMAGIPTRTKPKILRPKPDPMIPILNIPKQEGLTGLHRGKMQGNRLCRKIPPAVMKVEVPFDHHRVVLDQRKPKEGVVPIICGQKGIGPKINNAAEQSNARLRAKMTGAALLPDMKNSNKMTAKRAAPEYANTFKKPGKVNMQPPNALPEVGNVRMNLYRRND